ncbi:MAG: hypothetical protein CL609_22800 [Anaerolineaceae bacterium]|nr:hypothetical protein [Anaerolineaceae bacterium]
MLEKPNAAECDSAAVVQLVNDEFPKFKNNYNIDSISLVKKICIAKCLSGLSISEDKMVSIVPVNDFPINNTNSSELLIESYLFLHVYFQCRDSFWIDHPTGLWLCEYVWFASLAVPMAEEFFHIRKGMVGKDCGKTVLEIELESESCS